MKVEIDDSVLRQTSEFLRQLPEHILVDQNLSFASITQIANAKLPQEEKIKLLKEVNETPVSCQSPPVSTLADAA
jgi:hypothetical protein